MIVSGVMHKPDCNCNDCELPSGQAIPSTLVKGLGVVCGIVNVDHIFSKNSALK